MNENILRGSRAGDNVDNPYSVTEKDSNWVNSWLNMHGDVLPLINLTIRMTESRMGVNPVIKSMMNPVIEHLIGRIESLEREVSRLAALSHSHPVVHALPPPTLPGSRSVLEGEEPPEGENNDSWQSQEEHHKEDIKF